MKENEHGAAALHCPCKICGAREHRLFLTRAGYDVYRCTGCRTLFIYPFQDQPPDIYSEKYFTGGHDRGFGYQDYDRDKEPMLPMFREILSDLESAIGSRGRLLDVGAATGLFVRLAGEAGWTATGVELSEWAVRIARSRNLNVQQGTLSDLDHALEFDAVTMWDVIEHLPDPNVELEHIAKRLRRGGLLALSTPDCASLAARCLRRHWHHLVIPEHLFLFNRDSLKRLLRRHGFSIQSASHAKKSFTIQYVLSTLPHIHPGLKTEAIIAALSGTGVLERALSINTFDNLLIFAVKL